MSEAIFRRKLRVALQEKLGGRYRVEENKSLIYKVIVDEKLEYRPQSPKSPKRGEYAFQTDIVIGIEKEGGILPLVIIETKYEGFHTHDVITYSTKALKHKEVYPYVRYGLVVGGENIIHNKFFVHNVGFDFAIAINDISEETLGKLLEIIKDQLKAAENLLEIFEGKKKVKAFTSKIEIEAIRDDLPAC